MATTSKFGPKPSTIIEEAVIKVPRTAKPKATAKATPAEALHTEAAPSLDDPQVMANMAASINSMLSFTMPSGARLLIATVCGLLAYAGSLYWCVNALNYLALAVMLFTGSAFITFAISVVGWFFAIVGALRIGYKVAGLVLGFKTSDVTDSCEAVKTAVTSRAGRLTNWFKSSKPVTA